MKCLAAVAPFAAVGGSTNTFILITKAVGSFIKVRTASVTCVSFQLTGHYQLYASLSFMSAQQQWRTLCSKQCLCMQLYLLLLFLRVLLSWFPAFGWDKQPWLALRQVLS